MERDLRAHRGKETEEGDTLAEIGKEKEDSRRTVAYLIRLTYLLPGLLDAVDTGSLNFMFGVKLSYLPANAQQYLMDTILPEYRKIKTGQAAALYKMKTPTIEEIDKVFVKAPKPLSVTIKVQDLSAVLGYQPDKEEVLRLFEEFLNTKKEAST